MDGGLGGPGARLGGLVGGWRRAAGLSQRELAARSGLSVTAVRDLEQGRSHRPRAGSLAALAGALGLDAVQAAVLDRAAREDIGLAAAGEGLVAVPGSGLWVAVLGPVAAWRDGVALRLGPPGRRAVLAVLAVAGGELVRRETVMDVLWGQRPPGTAAELVAAHVSTLRRVLDPAGADGVLARAGAAGWRLRAGARELDVVLFEELARQAGAVAAAGDPAAACGLYEQALSLWRGDPAGDVAVLRGHPAVAELLRRRAEVVAGYAQAAFGLGWHERVIPLLDGLARAEPLNERVHARLMVALAGAGQQAAAVAVYEDLRRRLDEELGVYPGPELAEAHQRVLCQDVPAGEPAAGPVATMRTLPRDVAAFTGRDAELRRLVAAAAGAAGVVAIRAVDGMPGVGKTALVTRAAHLLAGDFPDGQLFVGLHAHTPGLAPADPAEVLAGLLACTGLGPREIPAGLEARAQRWRGRLAGRRVLLVLDDAAGQAQVEPLLPGTEGCLVLVTSRRRLIALDGAQPLALDTLPPGRAAELFARLSRRAPGGPGAGAVADLAALCGYLPLAIALLAGRLAHHPGWTITGFATDFAAARDRLAELAAGDRPGDPAVAAAFQMSYADLRAGPQRLFRLLGLHPGADIDACAAAALAGVTLAQARQDLDALYADHLIDEPAPGRYRLHDLIREYARTLAARHDPAADRDQAAGQLLDYYQHTAQAADRHLTRHPRPGPPPAATAPAAAPALPGQAAALAWMRAERANLLACTGYATASAQPRRIIALTAAMAAFLYQEGPWQQAAALHQAAAATALHHGDRLGEASALHELGRVRYLTGDYPAAAGLQEQALAIYQDIGSRLGEASALHDLGRVRHMTDDYPAAAGLQERALRIFQETGSRQGEASALHELGRVRHMTGDYPAAVGLQERALGIYQDIGSRQGEASALLDLGHGRYLTGDYPATGSLLERALGIYQDISDRLGEASVLSGLGRVRYLTGDYPAAAGLLERALGIYQDIGSRLGEASALLDLGHVRYLTGDYRAAAGLLERALGIYQDIGSRLGEANVLHDLGRVRYLTGDYPAAAGLLERSVALFREVGDAQGEAEALNATGALLAVSAGPREALAVYRHALQLARQVGSPLEEARALEGAARCAARTGDQAAARAGLSEAVAIYQRIGAADAGPASADLAAMDEDVRHNDAVQESIVN
jgi:DNA-binding SARP family transcriptional activator/tetratricopeptide (TPR) repeat protein/transcriptional regulator with XRE-family HTH domain